MQARIQEILRREGLSSSQFADRIGVQRSSVSHVVSGRNKPGFDFISKILMAFPGINAKWLITGEGEIYGNARTIETDISFNIPSEPVNGTSVKSDETKEYTPHVQTDPPTVSSKSTEIERIVVFYKDKTFMEFREES